MEMFSEKLFYFLILTLALVIYLRYKKRATKKSLYVKKEEFDARLTEPPSFAVLVRVKVSLTTLQTNTIIGKMS